MVWQPYFPTAGPTSAKAWKSQEGKHGKADRKMVVGVLVAVEVSLDRSLDARLGRD